MFQINALGLSEAERSDPLWDDFINWLPDGSAVLTRDINLALEGYEFEYYPPDESRPENAPAVPLEIWAHYYQLFRYWKKFGLFGGGSPAKCPPWYLDFLDYMDDVSNMIEAWYIKKANKESA